MNAINVNNKMQQLQSAQLVALELKKLIVPSGATLMLTQIVAEMRSV
jgi:hypothetical protein